VTARAELAQLRALANELGVAGAYETVDGVHHVTPVDTILAATRAMGVGVATATVATPTPIARVADWIR
jgi:hypothetical protein